MDNLSPSQQTHLKSIMWLIDSSQSLRCTGRTRVLAYAFMIHACTNMGKAIDLFDHLVHPTAVLTIMREIQLMMKTDEFKNRRFKINISMKTLTCED